MSVGRLPAARTGRSSSAGTARRLLAAVAVLAAVAAAWMTVSPAGAATGAVGVETVIDGRPATEATELHPMRLDPRRPITLELRVTNGGAVPVEVATVRLQGQVIALTFFAYDTSVGVVVPPGGIETRTFVIDLIGLGGQATGLIEGSVAILDGERRSLASQAFVVDVRGSLWSVYGAFGLAVAILTLVSLAGALVALASSQLPDNRWRRGLRFLTPGLGLGLVVVFTLSAVRAFVPRAGRWAPILLVSGVVLFALGYLTPSPDDEDDEDDEGDEGDEGRARHDAGADDPSGTTPQAGSGGTTASPPARGGS